MRGARPAAPSSRRRPSGPDAAHLAALDAADAAGKKLVDQEKWKRAEHPFDAYARLKEQARPGAFPKPDDNFRWRISGCSMSRRHRRAICAAAYSQWHSYRTGNSPGSPTSPKRSAAATPMSRRAPTCRFAKSRPPTHRRRRGGAGPWPRSRGAGADNIRNVTGSATAGIDPTELIDTRPQAHDWHYHVLNDRSLSGLPRKFNVAFDGGGMIADARRDQRHRLPGGRSPRRSAASSPAFGFA